jgi:hypothetical protein
MEEQKFRTALEGMGIKRCTHEDIAFLVSRIPTNIPGQPSICDLKF